MDDPAATLAQLRPDELYPTWSYVDTLEQAGELSATEARRWKNGIFTLMLRWGLEPDDVLPAVEL